MRPVFDKISNSYIHMTLCNAVVVPKEFLWCFFGDRMYCRTHAVNCSSNVHEFFFSKFARDTCSAAIVPTSKAAAKKSPHHQPHQCCKNHNRIHGVVRVCTCWTNENILNYYFLQKKTVNNL